MTGWWFGTFFIFQYIENFIIPTDFHSMICQGGSITNQVRLIDQLIIEGHGLLALQGIGNLYRGLVNIPFWEYWTSPYSSHLVDQKYLMVGWCSMGTFNDPCVWLEWGNRPHIFQLLLIGNRGNGMPLEIHEIHGGFNWKIIYKSSIMFDYGRVWGFMT